MKCPVCNRECAEGQKFCEKCGRELVGAGYGEGGADEGIGEGGASPSPVDPPKKRVSRVAVAAISALAVVCVVGISFFATSLFINGGAGQQSEIVIVLEDVPDESFRAYLSENIDSNDDGNLSAEEANSVTSIGTYENGVFAGGLANCGIKDLRGIEKFPNLEVLNCPGNSLKTLDVSCNKHLKSLNCSKNNLTNVSLPASNELEVLDAEDNSLASVDLSQASNLVTASLDDDTSVVGGEELSNEAKQSIEDMALTFAIAYVPYSSYGLTKEIVAEPGDSTADSNLIYELIYAGNAVSSADQKTFVKDRYDLDYETDWVNGNRVIFDNTVGVPLETGQVIIRSYYGTCPDLSYIDDSLLEWNGDGWTLHIADGSWWETIEATSWTSYGKVVELDFIVAYCDDAGEEEKSFHAVAVEDDESMFGYHMVSLSPGSTT